MPARLPRATTLGLGSTDHFTPFQLSMNGLGLALFWPRTAAATPVAQQSEAATHVTAVSRSSGVVGSGLGVALQAEPFQCSTNVVEGWPSASMVAPTAQQFDEPVQVTALRYCPSGLAAPARGTSDQVEPFQCSTKASLPDSVGKTPGRKLYWTWFGPENPTAQQFEGPEHVTESSWSNGWPEDARWT